MVRTLMKGCRGLYSGTPGEPSTTHDKYAAGFTGDFAHDTFLPVTASNAFLFSSAPLLVLTPEENTLYSMMITTARIPENTEIMR